MKTSTMLWLGAAAGAGYYLYKQRSSAATGPAVAGQLTGADPEVIVVDEVDDDIDGWNSYDYAPAWGGSIGGGWRRHGGGHHGGHGGGGHHGGHH